MKNLSKLISKSTISRLYHNDRLALLGKNNLG